MEGRSEGREDRQSAIGRWWLCFRIGIGVMGMVILTSIAVYVLFSMIVALALVSLWIPIIACVVIAATAIGATALELEKRHARTKNGPPS